MTQPLKKHDAPLDQRRLRMWLRLLRTTKAVESPLREFLREEFDTTLPRFDVLAALCRASEGMKMSELSRLLLVSNGNVTGIIDRLVTDGLVIRVVVEGDRRAMRVRLTRDGRKKFEIMAEKHKAFVSHIFKDLDHDDLDAMVNVFSRLREGE